MKAKAITFCQLALRSGNASLGDRLIPDIQSKKVYLVLYSSICGNNRKKKLINKCAYYNIPILEFDQDDFNTITYKMIQSMGIKDASLAQQIYKEMKG